ncbi:tRNA(Ile)-lysidine synthase [Cetobacterium ceti]|uniref:tRNA(Ile)-lysidine synthase n=1 Tax=Cetobacterium ceti TaxID=180163 RepID=A0A1T4JWR1_9FUSO|nr:tRNA lysidine(34) synthetase TilS [Cetobacterium ceti]SJZ34563.1 tRNA(Ile)-lysidine synthase [Cetobacterium ceti]
MKIFNRVLNKIKKENLIENGDRIVLGFSGGPDSVFLLEMFLKLKGYYEFDIVLAHVNHLLRGEDAFLDEEFCKNTGKKYNLPIYVKRIDINEKSKEENIGLEEAGRKGRYDFFHEIMEKENCNKIALAHNLDDQIETFLFRMIRGTSLLGLEGINSRDLYIRPINDLYKSEIMEYLNSNNIDYRLDLTNFENEYTRNSIRLDLIPFIEERYNPKFKEKISTLIKEVRDINHILKVDWKEYTEENTNFLSIEKIGKENEYIQRKILNNYLSSFSIEVTREKLMGSLKILNSSGSKEINLGKDYILKKEYNKIFIEKRNLDRKKEVKEVILEIPGKVEFFNYIIEAKLSKESTGKNEFLTTLKKGDRISIRNRKEGDRIIPTGMENSKKVKDILINEKIPKDEREIIPIVTFEEEVIWIAGIRGSEKYKASEKDGERYKLSVRRKREWKV